MVESFILGSILSLLRSIHKVVGVHCKIINERSFQKRKFNLQVQKIRKELPNPLKKSGNIAIAKIDVNGECYELIAHSSINFSTDKLSEKFVLSIEPEKRIFSTKHVDRFGVIDSAYAYSREWDTEVKILENIAAKFSIDCNVYGKIWLFTERMVCRSCEDVITNFRKKFPNIKMKIFEEIDKDLYVEIQ